MPRTSARLAVIDELDGFLSLEDQWNALAGRLPQPSVFLRHEWFRAAWAWRSAECRLRVLCIHVDAKLVGICPLVFRRRREGAISARMLEFLTVPDTQFCDVLADPAYRDAVLERILAWLHAERANWDCLELSYVRSDSPVLAALRKLLPSAGFHHAVLEAGTNPFVDCTGSWTDFYAGRSRRLKKGNNHVANKLARAGASEVLWVRSDSDRPLDETLERLRGISAGSWKRSTGLTLENPGPSAFIRTLSALAQRRGWLSVWFLLLDGQAIAMEYQLIYQGSVHALRADYLSARETLSPGTFLNWKLLQQLFEANVGRYYLGPGDNPYKERWTENGVALNKLQAYSPSWRGRALGQYRLVMRPAARKLLQRIDRRRRTKK